MKNLLLALALLASVGAAQAQVSKFGFAMGVGLVPMRSTIAEQANPNGYSGIQPGYVLNTYDANLLLLNLNLSFDAPLWQFAGGSQSLGVSLNAGAGLLATTRQDVDGFNQQPVIDLPEYVTYRYGAKASKHAKQTFGVGVGAGYRFSRFFLPFNSPSVMLEGVWSTSDSDWYLRLSGDLRARRFYTYYSSEGPVESLRIQEFNVLIGKSF